MNIDEVVDLLVEVDQQALRIAGVPGGPPEGMTHYRIEKAADIVRGITGAGYDLVNGSWIGQLIHSGQILGIRVSNKLGWVISKDEIWRIARFAEERMREKGLTPKSRHGQINRRPMWMNVNVE